MNNKLFITKTYHVLEISRRGKKEIPPGVIGIIIEEKESVYQGLKTFYVFIDGVLGNMTTHACLFNFLKIVCARKKNKVRQTKLKV